MKQYSTFIFDSYAWNPEKSAVELRYCLDDGVTFTETLTFPYAPPLSLEKSGEFDRAMFALHLIGGISYYKTCLPKTIEIRSGSLTGTQAEFWNSVYENGLGEFFFKNDIDFSGLIRFPSEQVESEKLKVESTAENTSHLPLSTFNSRLLVPLGGGKDSIVTAELLRGKADITLFRMGGHPLIEELAHVSGLPLITIKRALSPELFNLNAQGALNGHVPITAYLSFVTILVALLHEFDGVVLSNERSANVGNVQFRGKEINHQWSKSLEFERAFQDYVRTFITGDVGYFSLLRPLSELKIAEIFTAHPQYFPCTTSCNTNWKILGKKDKNAEEEPGAVRNRSAASDSGAAMNRSAATGSWCAKCPKCAFVFALYAAFLPKAQLLEIFGRNLFNDDWLTGLYQELLGEHGHKPFECVGTPEETKAAFLLAHRKGELEDSVIMKMFVNSVLPTIKKPDALITEALTPVKDHAIPKEFQDLVL